MPRVFRNQRSLSRGKTGPRVDVEVEKAREEVQDGGQAPG